MNLRVLVYSNPLVVDKIGKTFSIWKDSGFIFTRNLLASMPNNYCFYWVVPDKIKSQSDINWLKSANKNVYLVPYPYSTSIHQNRYQFSGECLRSLFTYKHDIDAIINNQPEVSANLRVWAFNQRRELPIILSFYHWLDCEESRKFGGDKLGGYFWRQYDGALASDYQYLHGNYAEKLFMREVHSHIKNHVELNIKHFYPPPTVFGTQPFNLETNKKIVLFNHRLNNTTNWRYVVDIATKIYSVRQDFVLWITDDTGSLSDLKFLQQLPFVILRNVPYENYGYLISNSHFAVCAHVGYSTWNMAVLDAIHNGCYSIAPDTSGDVYEYMFATIPDSLYSLNGLYDTMLRLLNTEHGELSLKNLEQKWMTRTPKLDQVSEDVEQLIIKRTPKSIRKYEDVYQYISNHYRCGKGDWVNKFWSFHTNSNFQRIRWKLLQEGIYDDTSQFEPCYYRG